MRWSENCKYDISNSLLTGNRKHKKGQQSHNGDSKSQVAFEKSEADAISFEIF